MLIIESSLCHYTAQLLYVTDASAHSSKQAYDSGDEAKGWCAGWPCPWGRGTPGSN